MSARHRIEPRRISGFTLIELLVVMTLLVTLSAIMMPIFHPSPAQALQLATRDVTTALREVRRQASASHDRRRFMVDTAGRRYAVGDERSWRRLPEYLTIELTTARSLLAGRDLGGVEFFPDGSSTGGRIRLGCAGSVTQIDVEWLTGKIRISQSES